MNLAAQFTNNHFLLLICANPNKRNFDENSILLILNKVRAASFIHIG